jgi:hypothetical protein
MLVNNKIPEEFAAFAVKARFYVNLYFRYILVYW